MVHLQDAWSQGHLNTTNTLGCNNPATHVRLASSMGSLQHRRTQSLPPGFHSVGVKRPRQARLESFTATDFYEGGYQEPDAKVLMRLPTLLDIKLLIYGSRMTYAFRFKVLQA